MASAVFNPRNRTIMFGFCYTEVKNMEYVYAAMLLHRAGKKVDEPSVKRVLEAAGVSVDETRVKSLIAALDGVNIDEAVQKAAAPVAAPAAPAGSSGAEAKKEEKKKEQQEEKKSEEEAAAGIGALFG